MNGQKYNSVMFPDCVKISDIYLRLSDYPLQRTVHAYISDEMFNHSFYVYSVLWNTVLCLTVRYLLLYVSRPKWYSIVFCILRLRSEIHVYYWFVLYYLSVMLIYPFSCNIWVIFPTLYFFVRPLEKSVFSFFRGGQGSTFWQRPLQNEI